MHYIAEVKLSRNRIKNQIFKCFIDLWKFFLIIISNLDSEIKTMEIQNPFYYTGWFHVFLKHVEDGILKCSVWLNVVTHWVHNFHVTYLSWFLLFFRKKSYYTDRRNKSMGRLVDDAWFVYDLFVIWRKKQEDIRLPFWAVVNFRKKHFMNLFKRFQNWLVANLRIRESLFSMGHWHSCNAHLI